MLATLFPKKRIGASATQDKSFRSTRMKNTRMPPNSMIKDRSVKRMKDDSTPTLNGS